jgi:uncharacterized membrane protein YphA (DoxX/SURF4 family)
MLSFSRLGDFNLIVKILKYILGFIFLYAGASKIFEPMLFKAVIQNYFSIPDLLALIIAIVVPWVQILAALSLFFNWNVLYSSGLLFAMSIFFFVLMVINYGQVLPFGCGCFGFRGEEVVGIYHIARDFSIAVLAGIIFYDSYIKIQRQKRKKSFSIEY